MKKYIGFIVLASFVFSFSLVLAQENNNTSDTTPTLNATLRNTLRAEISTTREAFKAQMLSERESYIADLKAKREAFAAEVKAKKEEFRQTNNESKNEFRDRASAIMEKRFQAAFINLERAQTKIEELITKISAEGKDTTSATESLNSSKEKLTNAKNKIAELKALLPTTGEEVTTEVFEKIKVGVREAKDMLKEAHNDLVQAIKELRTLKESEEDSN